MNDENKTTCANNKTIVCDLDGTLCEQGSYVNYQFVKPLVQNIITLNSYYNKGYEIIIFTARGMNTFDGNVSLIEKNLRQLTENWLCENKVLYHKLIFGKPAGDIYVDDKGISAFEFFQYGVI